MKNLLNWFAGILANEVKKKLLETNVKMAVLNLQPGDKINLRHPRVLSEVGYARLVQQVNEIFPGHKAIVLEEGLEIGVARVEERPDNAEPGIAEGVMFYCPSCKASVLDAWMTNAKIGDRVRCPSCKQGFNVTAIADGEANTVLVQP